ncbi:carbohydrate ABC transporter permease [Micromonospora yasonensis]|uniref:carbohydrate ABC transporter permease n=1 Tax=Micromonospora yasonensis TaxID=1128667 RepID=UPI00222FFA07|nr:carbohydrate ABC transporter permease [Micromonospora yasonensis]MCW3841776.1 carbohydrate ABC transporter permease [Micromonospora yasonensis]
MTSSTIHVTRQHTKAVPGTTGRGRPRLGVGAAIVYLILAVHLTVVIFPFLWMAYSSLKSNKDFLASVWSLPTNAQWANYGTALGDGKLLVYAGNSLAITVVSVALTVAMATAAGYAFVTYRTRWMPWVEVSMLVAMAIPAYVALVPLVATLRDAGLLDTRTGVVLPTVAFNLPVSVLIMRAFFSTVPRSLVEAARVDGASELRAFLRVMVPIARPAMFTTAIVNTIWVWNDFLFPLVLLNTPSKKTLPLGLTDYVGERVTDYPVLLAAILLAALGSFVVYAALQKHVIGGLTSGAVKQ